MRPYDLTTHDGETVDQLTKLALLEAEQRLGYPLSITQGSYNAGGVSASAGTHDGGGVVDLLEWNHRRKVRVLRAVGFAAWHRPAIPGLWPGHIHAVLIGNRKLSPAARRQVDAYLAGRNGLADNGPDTGPRDYVDHRFRWRTGAHRINRARALLERAQAQLAHGIRGYRVGPARRSIDAAIDGLPDAGP